jgi:hypothetical protein
VGLRQPDAQPAEEDRRQRKADPPLSIAAEAVPGEPCFELY